MSTTVKGIEARIDEDLRQPYEPVSGADLSDWGTRVHASYLYMNGVLVKTFTETVGTDGGLVRTGTGYIYLWVKKAYLGTLAVTDSTHRYYLQTRRIDAGYNAVLHEGGLTVKGYSTA